MLHLHRWPARTFNSSFWCGPDHTHGRVKPGQAEPQNRQKKTAKASLGPPLTNAHLCLATSNQKLIFYSVLTLHLVLDEALSLRIRAHGFTGAYTHLSTCLPSAAKVISDLVRAECVCTGDDVFQLLVSWRTDGESRHKSAGGRHARGPHTGHRGAVRAVLWDGLDVPAV